jgi:membrane protease YdiL (CAAX protease family)
MLSIKKNKIIDSIKYWVVLFIVIGAYLLGNIVVFFISVKCCNNTNYLIKSLENNLGKLSTFILILLPWIFVFIALVISAKLILGWSFRYLITNRNKIDFKRLFISFLLWFLISTIIFFFTKNDLIINNFKSDFFLLLFVAFIVLLVQTTAEELFFRSFLFKWFNIKISYTYLISIITGIIFGLLHSTNPEIEVLGKFAIIYYIEVGVFLSIISVIDDGLEFSIGFHFANNLFAALIVTNNWQVIQTEALYVDKNIPSYTVSDFIFNIIYQFIFIFFIYLFFWKKKFKNFIFVKNIK